MGGLRVAKGEGDYSENVITLAPDAIRYIELWRNRSPIGAERRAVEFGFREKLFRYPSMFDGLKQESLDHEILSCIFGSG